MKILISVLLLFAFQISQATHSKEHATEHSGEAKAHKDWNEVFKQPVADHALAVPPEKTQLLAPEFFSQVKGSEVMLKWKAVEGAKYHLQVATDPNYKWLVTNEQLADYTEYSLKGLQANQQYFWRVFTQKPGNARSYMTGPAVSSEFTTVE